MKNIKLNIVKIALMSLALAFAVVANVNANETDGPESGKGDQSTLGCILFPRCIKPNND